MATKKEIDEELERQETERKRVADEQKAMLEEQRRLAKEAGENKSKAEGMLEAIKTFQQMQASNGGKKEWSTEEWAAFQEKTGISKEGINAIDSALGSRLTDVENKFEARARQAEERAKAAESKYEEFEKTRSFESYKRDYFSKKPQFSRYEKDFDEFLSEFPAEARKDPARLDGIFKKAETYVKGKVGETEMRRNTNGSTRFGNDERDNEEERQQVDLSDLRSFERLTVEKILPTKEREEQLKANRHDMKGDAGVMVNSKADWDKYKK